MARYLDVWQSRLDALSRIFGKPSETIFTANPPIYRGGGADVVCFPAYSGGVAYVTAGLTGGGDDVEQPPGELGNYELVMCTPQPTRWVPDFLSQFARATLGEVYNPRETMDFPHLESSALEALLFVDGTPEGVDFEFNGERFGLLLCVGITKAELAACRKQGPQVVIDALRERGIFPWTDPTRYSVPTSKQELH